ncbi:MAG: DUF4199 domain-containing protein [Brumimicrobium sp.]|nr:DUF4199 domain-containing protein [Brumimicrobium sp.]
MGSRKIEFKWAIIFVLFTLFWIWMEKSFGLHDVHLDKHAVYSNFMILFAFVIYALALLDKRKNGLGGKMTYLQGFTSSMVITLIVTLFAPLTQYITSVYITPDYFNNIITYSTETGLMTAEEAANYFTLENYIIQTLIFTPVAGLLISLILPVFLKKR